jgi:hypothetical protein
LLDIMQANWPELIDPYALKGGPAVNLRWALDRVRAKLKANAIDTLFRRFDEALRASGYLAMAGQIIDATIVAAPKQRNTDEEKKAIKQGRIPNGWKDKPAKLRQKGLRCPLDGQIHQGQAEREWRAKGRSCDSGVRLEEPCLDRSPSWPDPQMDSERRSGF